MQDAAGKCKNEENIQVYTLMERKNSPINKGATILLVLIAFGAGLYAVRDMWLSHDSMRYALVSQQIAAGNGVRTPIIHFYGLMPDSNGTTAFIEQPPLLPIVLAILGPVNAERVWPGQVLNLLCHIAITIFSWLIARELVGDIVSIAVGLAVALSVSILGVCTFLFSEPLFIAFVTAAVYFLIKARHFRRPQGWLLAAGISASAAIATRYVGISILPLLVLEAAYLWKRNLKARTIIFPLACLALPMITAAILFIRNKLLLNVFRGVNQDFPGYTLFDSAVGTINQTLDELAVHGVGSDLLNSIGMAEYKKWVLLFAGILLIIWIMIFLGKSKSGVIVQKLRAGYDLIYLFIFGYAVVMIYGMYRYQPYFESRLFTPMIPFILILIVSLINPCSTILDGKLKKPERIAKFVLLTATVSCSFIWFFENPSVFLDEPEYWSRIDSSEAFKWLESNVPPDNIIATNYSFDLSFYGGYSTLKILTKEWQRSTILPENMEELFTMRMKQINAEYLALFVDRNGLSEEYFGKFIAGLSRREPADLYEIIFDSEDGVVYRLK